MYLLAYFLWNYIPVDLNNKINFLTCCIHIFKLGFFFDF